MIGRSMPDLHYREAGTPGDPAVLLVHGYPESSYMWREVLPALAAAGFHALAPGPGRLRRQRRRPAGPRGSATSMRSSASAPGMASIR
jgi:pimeloyl-ACP methyl ester carboxylesterase